MNAILGFVDLLKGSDFSDFERGQFIEYIENSGHVLLNTINELIEMANIETGQSKVTMSATNINEQIESVYNFFKSKTDEKGISFSFNTPLTNEQAMIISDSEKLNFIFANLVDNALKYSHDGKIELGYTKRGSNLEFYVKDNGIGISKKQKKIIFEKFRQGNETNTREVRGVGLGLTITKAFVEGLGGKIWVDSKEGRGSVFYFTTPYNSAWETEIAFKSELSA
ncbi:MAG: HAMP domain-containing sensor histidine kinase [Ignavibacteriaceae bacterium]